MRDKKFRSWNDFLLVFVYFENGKYWYEHDGKHFDMGFHAFDWNNAEQYTGLKDKNGNDICNSDLFYDTEGRLLKVVYIERMACFIGLLVSDETLGYPLHFMDRHEIEIIGNIHQNPELLEDK